MESSPNRRKSLSLADLGVAVPKRSRAQSHPSPPSTIVEGEESERPKKISKTSHASTSPPPSGLMSPPRTTLVRIKEENPKQELSPPPSPVAEGCTKVNLEGLSDDIVVATIQQLEATGNRPIFVKELAAVLATRLHSVEKCDDPAGCVHCKAANIVKRSANPSALISSRLTSYLNRSWPAISPCPLAKDLSPVHPRRLYFYLTTMPRQPVPEPMEIPKQQRIISPSISSASAMDEEDERYDRSRQVLSPSPEVDLSSPELEDEDAQEPPTPGRPFSGRNSVSRSRATSTSNLAHNRRAASPQLEHEERDFKQTASALHEQAQQRRNSQSQSPVDEKMDSMDTSAGAEQEAPQDSMLIEESEDSVALKHSEAAEALFGHAHHLKPLEHHPELFSSPLMQPQSGLRIDVATVTPEKLGEPMEHLTLDQRHVSESLDSLADWDALKSPETMDMSELEDLFDAY